MSSKDYKKFAALIAGEIALAENRQGRVNGELTGNAKDSDILIGEAMRQQSVNIARGFADMAKQDNPRFDRDRFYCACGMVGESVLNDADGTSTTFWS